MLNEDFWQRGGFVFRQVAVDFDVYARVVRAVVHQHFLAETNGVGFELKLSLHCKVKSRFLIILVDSMNTGGQLAGEGVLNMPPRKFTKKTLYKK